MIPESICFLAAAAEFAEVLHGWKHAPPLLVEPVVKELRNPLTGQPLRTVRTRIGSERPTAEPDAVMEPALHRLPGRELPGLGVTELMPLAEEVMSWDSQQASDELLGRAVEGPEGLELAIFELPPALVRALADIKEGRVESLAAGWSKRHLEDASTADNEFLRDLALSIPPEVWTERLQSLVAVAREAIATERRMYFCMVP